MGSLSSVQRFAHVATSLRRAALGFSREEGGATAIEYGLVCAFVALITIGAMRILGAAIIEAFPKAINFPTSE